MQESLNSVRLTTPPSPLSRSSPRGGRGKAAPFTLSEEPPTETSADEAQETTAWERAYEQLDVGHRLDDEEGRELDITA